MQRRIERRFGTPWDGLRGREIAPRLDLPLLVLHDRDDAEVPCAHGETLAAAWPGARLHRTSGLGHRRILRDPEVVARSVAFLLREPAASGTPPAEPALALASGPG
jgi:pimeloyl-ACP methyl ester carboxylesterase